MSQLESAVSVPALVRAACQELVDRTEASACVISRVVGEMLVQIADYSLSGRSFVLGHGYLIPDYPVTSDAIERREPRAVSRLDDAPDPGEAGLLGELGFDSVLMMPLIVKDNCWGLVELYADRGRRFTAGDAKKIEELASETSRLVAELEAKNGARALPGAAATG